MSAPGPPFLSFGCLLGFANHGMRNLAKNNLHHGEMFKVVVGLEERFAGEEFNQHASDRPDIARVGPTCS